MVLKILNKKEVKGVWNSFKYLIGKGICSPQLQHTIMESFNNILIVIAYMCGILPFINCFYVGWEQVKLYGEVVLIE